MPDRDWRGWIEESLQRGVGAIEMVGAGVGEGLAREWLADASRPQAAEPVSATTSAESWSRVRQQVREADPDWRTVPRLHRPNPREFVERAYAANRPVVLEGVASGWPALRKWTGDYLAETVGNEPVEAMAGRASDPDYKINGPSLRRLVPFSDLVKLVESGKAGNDVYLTANNHFLERPAAEPLLADFEMPTEYLDPAAWRGRAFLWYGSDGTVTPTHHDTMNVLFAQVRGRKRFLLLPPEYAPRVYNSRSVYADVDLERPDLARFTLYEGVEPMEIVVCSGDVLFIPVGWWHHVRSLEVSLSLTFTNFAFPNSYEW